GGTDAGSGQLGSGDAGGVAAGASGGSGTAGGGGGSAAAAGRRGAAVGGAAAGTANQVAAGSCGAAAPAGGNGGATDTGVSGDTIKVGGTFFNGNYLDQYSIGGRKIQFIPCDTAGTADGTKGCLSKLADQDKVFTMGPSLDFNLNI